MTKHEIPELDAKGLRSFGLTTGAIIAVLFGLFFPWLLEVAIPVWPWMLGSVLAVWGLIHAASLRLIYTGWMKFGLLLSKITTPIVMGIVFYGVILPMGLLMRLSGKDPMQRKLDATQTTWRVVHDHSVQQSMTRPF